MTNVYKSRGYYFEDYTEGFTILSPGRTITEADIVNFSGVAGDYNQIHTNVDFARKGAYGRRIAQGLLVLSIANGLLVQSGFVEGTIIAFREITWKFSKPVFIGDTIYAKAVTAHLRAMPPLGGGTVTFDVEVTNQDEGVVQRGQWVALIASKPG